MSQFGGQYASTPAGNQPHMPQMNQFATSGGVSMGGGRDYVPTLAEERAYYDQLFSIAEPTGSGQLQGLQAVTFFKLSGLDVSILKYIWTVADSRGNHFLLREDFYVAMRLIALAQAGQPATREKLLETATAPIPYARFQSIPIQPPPVGTPKPPSLGGSLSSVSSGSASSAPPPSSGGAADPYCMSPEERGRYLNHFGPCDTNQDGFVEGAQAVELFSRSGLDRATLGKVWELSDADHDQRLNPTEFAIAMHLIVCISKRGLPVPPKLPTSLVSLTTTGTTPPPSSSPSPLHASTSSQQAIAPLPTTSAALSSPATIKSSPPKIGLDALPSMEETSMSALAAPGSAATTTSTPSLVAPTPIASTTAPLPKQIEEPPSRPMSSSIPPPRRQSTLGLGTSLGGTGGGGGGGGGGSPGDNKDLGSIVSEGFRLSRSAVDVQDAVLHTESGLLGNLNDLLNKLRAEKISLTATVESNASEAKRMGVALQKTFQEIMALQSELTAIRKASSQADEETRLALSNLGAARKHRELLLQEVEKGRMELERLNQQNGSLAEELASLRLEAVAVHAGAEGLDGVIADHKAVARANRSESDLIKAILAQQASSKATLTSDISNLNSKIGQAKAGLATEQSSLAAKQAELAQAQKEKDATTAERHATLLRLAEGDRPLPTHSPSSLPAVPAPSPATTSINLPPKAVTSTNSNSNSAPSPYVSMGTTSSSTTTTPASTTTAPPPPADTKFGFKDDEDDDFGSSSALPTSTKLTPSSNQAPTSFTSPSTTKAVPATSPSSSTTLPTVVPTQASVSVAPSPHSTFDDDDWGTAAAPSKPQPSSPPKTLPTSSPSLHKIASKEAAFPPTGDSFSASKADTAGADGFGDFPEPDTSNSSKKALGLTAVFPPADQAFADFGDDGAKPTTTTGGGGGGGNDDAFPADPFSFPEGDGFGPPAFPSKEDGSGFSNNGFDDFGASAFDKF